MLHSPDILIMDEPTEGLDPNQRVPIRDLIKRIGHERTVLLSTHVLQEVEETCDRLLIHKPRPDSRRGYRSGAALAGERRPVRLRRG